MEITVTIIFDILNLGSGRKMGEVTAVNNNIWPIVAKMY
jgi:hypothetical protein